MRKTGIFSGSFNPIHIGHLALANWLCEFEDLEEIWFLITPQNPLKIGDGLLGDQLRYEMARIAIGNYPKFKVSDFEFSLPKPFYTINTLNALRDTYPDCSFHFIMGADNWMNIFRWKDYETLISQYPVIVYPRFGYKIEIPTQYPYVKKIDAPIIEISSSFIRESYLSGKDVRFFLPESIRKYYPYP